MIRHVTRPCPCMTTSIIIKITRVISMWTPYWITISCHGVEGPMTSGYYCAIFPFCGGGKKKDAKKTEGILWLGYHRYPSKKQSNSTVAGYALQFPRKGTSDHVIITRGMPNLSAVTVCLGIKTADTRNAGTPLSYVVSGGREELLLYDYRNFRVFINNHHRFKYLIWSFVLLLITIVVLI